MHAEYRYMRIRNCHPYRNVQKLQRDMLPNKKLLSLNIQSQGQS